MTTKQPDGKQSIIDDIEKAEAAATRGAWQKSWQKSEDNPFLPPEYIEQLKRQLDPKIVRRMLYCEFVENDDKGGMAREALKKLEGAGEMKVDLDEMEKRYVGEGPGYAEIVLMIEELKMYREAEFHAEQSACYDRKHNDDRVI